MLKDDALEHLRCSKNLLAFSSGVDSTCLFFMLIDAEVEFDIAIDDYAKREQSKQEIAYASELAKKHKLKCYIHKAKSIEKNFEADAREVRYDFFDSLVKQHNYKNLLTAHHLGDRFEWMLMQFCRGAGCAELSGMKTYQQRQNYTLIRPLLHLDKSELLEFLTKRNIKYFEDESNLDDSYTRNKFRHNHTNPLISLHLQGIKKSFEYIDRDVDALIDRVDIQKTDDFAYFTSTNNKRSDIYAIDKHLKSLGLMISANERELLKTDKSVVVGRKYVVSFYKEYIFIAPYLDKDIKMSKEFKERMRKLKIEPKLRVYFYTHLELFESLALE
jgi:tRNA(Ile)-lysidine synthase